MPSEPTILAFDTSAAHCAAALLRGDSILISRAEPMSRGQAERLMPLLEEVLTENGCGWGDLDAIGVGIGPGNFTGIRISVSAARGLALGLEIPAVGVTGFDAISEIAPQGHIPAIRAPREMAYVLPPGASPELITVEEAESLGPIVFSDDPTLHVKAIAAVAARRRKTTKDAPAPFYLRPADAAPSKDQPPDLLDE